jgi:glutamate/tyrosine decarboxylase-like PLP-dependent enzyme
MARPLRIDRELIVKAPAVAAQTAEAKTLRAAQAVLMSALAHTTLEQTAALLGVGRASVLQTPAPLPGGASVRGL